MGSHKCKKSSEELLPTEDTPPVGEDFSGEVRLELFPNKCQRNQFKSYFALNNSKTV
jgi:hypothetical protein